MERRLIVIVTGINTTIVQALSAMVREPVSRADVNLAAFDPEDISAETIEAEDRYVFAQGHMLPKRIDEQSAEEIKTGLAVNMVSVVRLCERVLDLNPRARICIIGSMSGVHGSHDQVYALAKAGSHRYVELRRLFCPDQQLVCVAPGIIWDSGMTQRRADVERLRERMEKHPKGRYVSAVEVARLVHFLLYVDAGYITNTVIEMDGGVR